MRHINSTTVKNNAHPMSLPMPALYKIPLVLTLATLMLTGYVPGALAHHPHDIIDALAVSPTYDEDKTVYIANRQHLLKSTNGGHSWKELSNGLDHSQTVSAIIIPPSKRISSTLFIATMGSGVYHSADAGKSWKNTSHGLSNLSIQRISAHSEDVVLAIDVNGRLFKTADAGAAWRPVNVANNSVITAVSPPTHLADTRILAGDSVGRIFLSADHGSSWEKIARLPVTTDITVIAFDPSDTSGNTFFTGTRDHGLYKTNDMGKSFRLSGKNDLSSDTIAALVFSPNFSQDHLMVATTWHQAAFLSADGGATWTHYNAGLTTDKQADTADYRSAHFRQASITTDGNTLFIAGFNGLFKSDNGGHNWRELETLPVSHIKYVGVSPADDNSYSVGVTTYGGGAYISADYGASWLIGNKGIKTSRLMGINFSPDFPRDHTIFSGSIGYLLKSMNDGATWETIKLTYPTSLRKRVIEKLIKLGMPSSIRKEYLEKPDRQPVYPTVINLSPDYANDGTVFFGTRWHGMFRSDNSGHDAYNILEYSDGPVTSLAISPDFSKNHTVFVYVRGDSLYKSTDRGDSWRRITNGLPFPATRQTHTRKLEANKHFIVEFSPGYNKDRTLFVAGPAGLFKSENRGERWHKINIIDPGMAQNILAIGVSPNYANDQTLIISLKGHGLYASSDGGRNFTRTGAALLEDNHSIEILTYSNNNTIYAASDETLFSSTDGGAHWTQIDRPVRYEDRRGVLRYEGNWTSKENPEFSASTIHYSETAGDKASLDFTGCRVRWISNLSPMGGIANVYIDSLLVDTVDLHSEQNEPMAIAFSSDGLPCRPHTITVEVTKRQGEDSAGNRVALDAFDILPRK